MSNQLKKYYGLVVAYQCGALCWERTTSAPSSATWCVISSIVRHQAALSPVAIEHNSLVGENGGNTVPMSGEVKYPTQEVNV